MKLAGVLTGGQVEKPDVGSDDTERHGAEFELTLSSADYIVTDLPE